MPQDLRLHECRPARPPFESGHTSRGAPQPAAARPPDLPWNALAVGCSLLLGAATYPRSLLPQPAAPAVGRTLRSVGEPISLQLARRRGIEEAFKEQLKLANSTRPVSYAPSVSVLFVSDSMAQIDGAT